MRALLESEHTYHLVFARERDAMSLIDAETKRFLDVNDAWCALYGYTRDEALTMTPRDVKTDPDPARLAPSPGYGPGRHDLRWHKKRDGTVFPVELVCGSFAIGERGATYVVARDISERVAADEALRRSEAGFRTLIESLPEAVLVHRDGEILYANPAAIALMGLEPSTGLQGLRPMELVHPADRDAVEERLCRGTAPEAATFRAERLVRRDGVAIDVELAAMPVEYEGAGASLAIARDVTERKRMEARLLTSDRLVSLGRLAASVGHEINNPLAWMIGNLQLVERELRALTGTLDVGTLGRLQERVGAIADGAERVRTIVRDLKTLARDDVDPPAPVELHRALDVCADMAAHELRHRARLVKEYLRGDGEADAATPLAVLGNEGRVGQAFLNLIVNAAQAIPEGAVQDNEVRLRTSFRAADALHPALAIVEVEDTGIGIAADVRERLFEPFFTTKSPGAGTGLGLSISHHVVTSMGGRIEVEPRAGGGTRFRVLLPLAEVGGERARGEPPSVSPGAEPAGARARILVVDDQEAITHVLADVLWDHDVVRAHSGREAIELLVSDDRFDVVLCDLMMDDLTGIDVYEHLVGARPGIERRMILMSGGAYTDRARELLARVSNPLVEKPFRIDAVRHAVRQVLDRRALPTGA
ncbi:MAG: PAS domain S-box protein [Myxococcota bacterium]|nr:PAS domain S-box protein [Myxococcota bacterium]